MTKVALITGASSGIGHEMALQLADQGYLIAAMARRKDRLMKLSELIEKKGGQCLALACDVSSWEQVQACVGQVEDEFGPIQLLVANAGMGDHLALKDFCAVRARAVYEVNILGLMQSIAAVLPYMMQRKSGQIVGISSQASLMSFPSTYVYCASKAAVSAHLEGLRVEAAPYGIKVTNILPGFIRTDMTARNNFSMPFIMDLTPAVKRMIAAIHAQKSIYIFPKRLYFLLKLVSLLPKFLLDRAMRKSLQP